MILKIGRYIENIIEKKEGLDEQCEEVEELCRMHQHSRYGKIKKLTQRRKGGATKKKDGTEVMESEEAGKRKSEYIGELFDDETSEMDGAADEKESLQILESEGG